MFKCKSCGREYISESSLAGPANGFNNDEFMIFDGEKMRYVCPLCGGLVYSSEELETLNTEKQKAA